MHIINYWCMRRTERFTLKIHIRISMELEIKFIKHALRDIQCTPFTHLGDTILVRIMSANGLTPMYV